MKTTQNSQKTTQHFQKKLYSELGLDPPTHFQVFLEFFEFFNLAKPLSVCVYTHNTHNQTSSPQGVFMPILKLVSGFQRLPQKPTYSCPTMNCRSRRIYLTCSGYFASMTLKV